jgi:hypothetical protein
MGSQSIGNNAKTKPTMIRGEVLEKAGEPTDAQTARGLKQVNPKHQLT